MNSFLDFIIESNLYLICFYLVYQIILVRDKHFRFNRLYLMSSLLLALLLPLLTFEISTSHRSINSLEGYILLPSATVSAAQTESVGFIIEWWHIIGLIYVSGIVFYATRLLMQILKIFRHLPLNYSTNDRYQGYKLIPTQGELPTCSFFHFLFWDKSAELTKEESAQIFEHELAHIKQWHSLDILIIEMVRVVFWFNPAVHLIKTRITEVHEYLADHYATRSFNKEAYSKLLTLRVFKSLDFALSNNFHKSQVVKRIRMLKSHRSKSIWLNLSLLLPAITLLIAVLSCNVSEDMIPLESKSMTSEGIPSNWSKVTTADLGDEHLSKYLHLKIRLSLNAEAHVLKQTGFIDIEDFRTELIDSGWTVDSYWHENDATYALVAGWKNTLDNPLNADSDIHDREIYTVVKNQPKPIGGMTEFYQYISRTMTYPLQARQQGIEGKVFVEFIVDREGSIRDVNVLKGIGAGCDKEAARVVEESPLWIPGIQDGRRVDVKMVLPITFKLG